MAARHSSCSRVLVAAVVAFFWLVDCVAAEELLVADRLTNRVYRYGETGQFLGVLINDPVNLDEPNGLALSPDGTHLYIASRGNNQVVRYDYNGATATNPQVVVSSGVDVPASVLFSADGSRLYVSNLGQLFNGSTVGQFNPSGASAGPELTGGAAAGRTGLALSPTGDLLASSFQNGAVLRYNQGAGAFEPFIGPNPLLSGAGNILIHGNDLYLAAGFTGSVAKFNATTGAPDPAFTPISGLGFPASLALAPDGNGILVGDLSITNGDGSILRFGFDGTPLGMFKDNSTGMPDAGFSEATGMLVSPIPEPSTAALGILALFAVGFVARRRMRYGL
jgi:DNA-binding beta-propeller fold protein YncE